MAYKMLTSKDESFNAFYLYAIQRNYLHYLIIFVAKDRIKMIIVYMLYDTILHQFKQ